MVWAISNLGVTIRFHMSCKPSKFSRISSISVKTENELVFVVRQLKRIPCDAEKRVSNLPGLLGPAKKCSRKDGTLGGCGVAFLAGCLRF